MRVCVRACVRGADVQMHGYHEPVSGQGLSVSNQMVVAHFRHLKQPHWIRRAHEWMVAHQCQPPGLDLAQVDVPRARACGGMRFASWTDRHADTAGGSGDAFDGARLLAGTP